MKRNPEAKFRAAVLKELKEHGVLTQAIESEISGRGIPDAYIACVGLGAWIEFKVDVLGEHPCRRKVAFRPRQHSWLKDNAKNGGYSFVAIRYFNGYVFANICDVDETDHLIHGEEVLYTKHIRAAELLPWIASQKGRTK